MREYKIVLIRCPQPLLIGAESGALYSPNRSRTPEPTLPQLEGIIRHWADSYNVPVQVIQLDLRDPVYGEKIQTRCYGQLKLPYLNETLNKIYQALLLTNFDNLLAEADFIGFTNNFSMSRRLVADHIAYVRKKFPDQEIWLGGRDIYTERVKNVYMEAAGKKNLVIFEGHVMASLPAYLLWKIKKQGQPFGVTIYNNQNQMTKIADKSLLLNACNGEIKIPLPIYHQPKSLEYLTGSGEGQPNPPFGRFVHMSISIGCPQACGYCTTGYRERFLVHKDLETIIQELELYKKLGVTTIGIMDDNLLALGIRKVKNIMSIINNYGFSIEYGNGLQLSLLAKHWSAFKKPVLDQCVSLYAPLEDLTKEKMYKKLDSINSQFSLMKKIAREKTDVLKYVTMGVIVGVPGHTKKLLETNLMSNIEKFLGVFSGSNLAVGMTVFNFMPLPGAYFGELALNSDRLVVKDMISQDPEVCNFSTTSYAPNGMTHQEVFKIYKKALELNPAGKKLGLSYVELQKFGEKILPKNERWKIPPEWKIPGFHLRDKMS